MAISIDYITNEILVPKADTVFLEFDAITGREKRSLDLTALGIAIGDIQDNQEGAWASTAYFFTQENTVGATFIAPALNILSPYTITFEAGTWAVFLINGNSNVQALSTINGVSVNSSNSGGLVGSAEIANQSYIDARVSINTTLGTTAGKGTPTDPVSDFPEAKIIADTRNFNGYYLSGDIALDNTEDLLNSNWRGENQDKSSITATNIAADKCTFRSVEINGTIASGRASFKNCALGDGTGLDGFDGVAENCSFPSTITLNSSGTKPIMFRQCYSAVAGSGKPVVDCDGVTVGINFREQDGGLEITNFNGGGDMSIDAGGVLRLKLASTCTSGTIVVGGVLELDDQSGVGCTVIRTSTSADVVWDKVLP